MFRRRRGADGGYEGEQGLADVFEKFKHNKARV